MLLSNDLRTSGWLALLEIPAKYSRVAEKSDVALGNVFSPSERFSPPLEPAQDAPRSGIEDTYLTAPVQRSHNSR